MSKQPPPSKKQTHSIASHTTCCAYCGHRVLPQNLEGHIKRIHPEKTEEKKFLGSLKRTATEDWWAEARRSGDVIPLGDVYSEVVKDPPPSKNRISRSSSGYCPLCKIHIKWGKFYNHMREFHKARYNAVSGTVEAINPARGLANVPEPRVSKTPQTKPVKACDLCGNPVPEEVLEKHRTRHVYDQPYRDAQDVHCPICKINIQITSLTHHIQVIHPEHPTADVKPLVHRVTLEEYYGMKQTRLVQTRFGGAHVGTRGWAQCPLCQTYVQVHRLEKHFQKIHS